MRLTGLLQRNVRRTYTELDFARHVPDAYVTKVKQTVPKKVYANRFGAPAIIRWTLHPNDFVPSNKRPWELSEFEKNSARAQKYHRYKMASKFFDIRHEKSVAIPKEEWTFFPGDVVQVMVGKDKGKTGSVSHVVRDTNAVFVRGKHTKLENDNERMLKQGFRPFYRQIEQPLYVHKQQVMLVDPSDNEPCEAEWKIDDVKNEFIRVSKRTGFQIPLPESSRATSEYVNPDQYVEAEGKDTPASIVLEKTYRPVLKSFEDEIAEEMGIHENRNHKPSYWY